MDGSFCGGLYTGPYILCGNLFWESFFDVIQVSTNDETHKSQNPCGISRASFSDATKSQKGSVTKSLITKSTTYTDMISETTWFTTGHLG